VIEGKIQGRIEVIRRRGRRRGRRRKQLLDELGDRRGYSHLKEEALDCIKWRNRFGRGCGPVDNNGSAHNNFLLLLLQHYNPVWVSAFSSSLFHSFIFPVNSF
jgi:hypothetical protein